VPPKGHRKDNPKKLIHFRADEQTEKHLIALSESKGITKSEVIRNGIEIQYKEQEMKNG